MILLDLREQYYWMAEQIQIRRPNPLAWEPVLGPKAP